MRALLLLLLIVALFVSGCTDPNRVIDNNAEIPNQTWSYTNKLKYDVKIEDEASAYNLYFNLRVTGDYKYSNIFIILKHDDKSKTRYEFKLANPDGEWLGSGSGNLYSYRFALRTKYKFPAKGLYHFEIEQNMRDNPLPGVINAGLRVEKDR
ncbi:gliding motility lipoprotein GldH [Mucilaginibacter hurinus]|uniref:Gliding motility lipoprotein GldH n=1 Tax=Mucilaginibacter hurinus TaxID=2201324 RepID=A0A367GPG2_9SPHI|nr:gliding motility lipoprotein GldH [Mucilaginibacter hurinus]RCH54726.1 gliding motility lipoprotein GldH [Mucilaginibacter hurinus]